MPLLSTLAALVIIVHSAEEGLDREVRDRRYDLRPRLLDTRPTQNEQVVISLYEHNFICSQIFIAYTLTRLNKLSYNKTIRVRVSQRGYTKITLNYFFHKTP